MQDLIKKLTTEAGLSADQAAKALNVMVTHVKSILPPAFAGSIDNMLSAKPEEVAAMAASAAAAKGSEVTEGAKDESFMAKAGTMAGDAKGKIEDMADKAGDKLEDLADKAKEKFGQYVDADKIEDMADKAGDKLEDLADKADEIAKGAIDKLKGFFGGKDNK
jgi:hypothetical protein